MIFAREQFYSKMEAILCRVNVKLRYLFWGLVLCALVLLHSFFIKSYGIAPFTGIGFICAFRGLPKPKWLQKILLYFSKHSTNIWLVHMIFYLNLFPSLVFVPRLPAPLIFLWLLALCLASSYCINLIYHPLLKGFSRLLRQEKGSRSAQEAAAP
jgi:hypothetical protein